MVELTPADRTGGWVDSFCTALPTGFPQLMAKPPKHLCEKEAQSTGTSVTTVWRDNLLRRVRECIRIWNAGNPCLDDSEVRQLARELTGELVQWLQPRMEGLRQATLEWFFADPDPDPVPGDQLPAPVPSVEDRPFRARKRL